MKSAMTIAAGIGIGYFLYQLFFGGLKRNLNGRLHKSRVDKKLAGVCGGIAEYLGCDATIVRLIWAALVLGWGSGVLLYLICALVLPEE